MLNSAGVTVRVLICDDHPALTDGLSMVLLARGFDGVDVVATATQAIERIATDPPDVVLMDYQLPDLDGVTALRRMLELEPGLKVVVLTATTDERVAGRALEAGARGYVTKHRSTNEIVDAVRAAIAGEVVVSSDVLPRVMAQFNARATETELTCREIDVLELMAVGLSNDEIAARLYISRNTVRSHVQHVLQKLGAHSRLEGVLIANRSGLLPIS